MLTPHGVDIDDASAGDPGFGLDRHLAISSNALTDNESSSCLFFAWI